MANFNKSWRADVGLNNVPSYQVSGQPFATGSVSATSVRKIEFPYVTRWVQVINNGGSPLKVGFSKHGVQGTNYFRVAKSGSAGAVPNSAVLEVKCSEIWLYGSTAGGIDIVAGLTSIPTQRTYTPSGS